MSRAVLVALVVVTAGLSVAVPAPVPKDFRVAPPRLSIRLTGAPPNAGKKAWTVELLAEWRWVKPDESGGLVLTKWRATGDTPFDGRSLLVKGEPDPGRVPPAGSRAIRLTAESDALLLVGRPTPVADAWRPNTSFGFSDQDTERRGPLQFERRGHHYVSAPLRLVTTKGKAFAFDVAAGETGTVTPVGPDTTTVAAGDVKLFLATNSAGHTHVTVHGNLGGTRFVTTPNSKLLPRGGKFVQESDPTRPAVFGGGHVGRWRIEYADGGK